MKKIILCFVFVLSIGIGCTAEKLNPTIANGVISYTTNNGQRKVIEIGEKCADLWVAPDDSVFAFIAVKEMKNEYLTKSDIYIARRTDQFKPMKVVLTPILINGTHWQMIRQPSLSPDLKTVYFIVPLYMTSFKLMAASLQTGIIKEICDTIEYCVIWGGQYSGDLIIKARREENGAFHPCFLRNKVGDLTKVAEDNECYPFTKWAAKWGQEHKGFCQSPDYDKPPY